MSFGTGKGPTHHGLAEGYYGQDFHGKVTTPNDGTTLVLQSMDPDIESLADMAAAGENREYRIQALHVYNPTANSELQILNGDTDFDGAGIVYGKDILVPAGFGVIAFPRPGLRVGENKTIYFCSTSGVVMEVEVFGVIVHAKDTDMS